MTNDAVSAINLQNNEGYDDFVASIRAGFEAANGESLFTTAASGSTLYELFLSALPADRRQHYNCHNCRRFFERYGNLVTINEKGEQRAVAWNHRAVPEFFRGAVAVVEAAVEKSNVDGVFVSSDPVWGVPENRDGKRNLSWSHISVTPPKERVYRGVVKTAGQIEAERRVDFNLIREALKDYSIETAREARKLLVSGNLYRPEKHVPMAEWLVNLHETVKAAANGRAERNVVWRAIATAPTGYAHLRSSGVFGTLLDDVKAGLPFDTISRKWSEKLDPLAYRRTQAAPTRGNIEEAEKIVAKLGIAESLKRRFAQIEDLTLLWRPTARAEEPVGGGGGVFGHLRAKDEGPAQKEIATPPTKITWEKFRRTVLPSAEEIEVHVPMYSGQFVAFVTAANPEAPPIVQYDLPEQRNPVTWYFRSGKQRASSWNVTAGWVKSTGVVLKPSMWNDENKFAHMGRSVTFLVDGMRDTNHRAGGGVFTELLRSEFHSIRSTLEAHFNSMEVAGKDDATACGICVAEGPSGGGITVRVRDKNGKTTYHIDRWD